MRRLTIIFVSGLIVGCICSFTTSSAAEEKVLKGALSDSQANEIWKSIFENDKLANRADSLRRKPNPTHEDTVAFVAIYRQLATEKGGLPWANYEMGEAYDLGWGMPKDTVEAYRWYLRSAEMGDRKGMRSAGVCKLIGHGTTKDVQGGIAWLDSACVHGNVQALAALGSFYHFGSPYTPQDEAKALKYLWPAADSGDLKSQKLLFWIYGSDTSRYYDNLTAAKWSDYLATKGDPAYQTISGENYVYGIGVEQDYVKGGNYYYKAAKQNYGIAETELSRLYLYGRGTRVNYVQSYAWAVKGMTDGSKDAIIVLDSLELLMTKAQKDSGAIATREWIPLSAQEARREKLGIKSNPNKQGQRPSTTGASDSSSSTASGKKATRRGRP